MKSIVRKIIRSVGFDVVRYNPATSRAAQLQTMLALEKIDFILDVGANAGQYVRYVRSCGYKGRIVSFEPLTDAYNELVHISKGNPLWEIAPRMAIGAEDWETEINISRNSVSSSLMPMLNRHLASAPESGYVGVEKTRVARLDSIAPGYIGDSKSVFLKIDTQGYEKQVLDGAVKILPIIKGIGIELSTVPLYEGSMLFADMIKLLQSLEFELHGIYPEFNDPRTGQMLQADGLFFRR